MPAIWLLLVFVLASCRDEPIQPATVAFVETLRHENGLTLGRPEGFRASIQENGIHLMPEYGSRSTPYVEIARQPDAPTGLDAEAAELAGVGPVSYAMTQLHNPGSGGDEHRLIAWRAVGDHWIVLTAGGLAEAFAPSPDFGIAWAVFASVEAR